MSQLMIEYTIMKQRILLEQFNALISILWIGAKYPAVVDWQYYHTHWRNKKLTEYVESLNSKTANTCIRRNFCQEKIFTNFAICSHWWIFYHTNCLSCTCVNDYIEDMATFTALAKNLFHRIFLWYKDSWAWWSSCQAKIFTYAVHLIFLWSSTNHTHRLMAAVWL